MPGGNACGPMHCFEPCKQRVCPGAAPHDQIGLVRSSESAGPVHESAVQRLLADVRSRVRPAGEVALLLRHLVWDVYAHVIEAERERGNPAPVSAPADRAEIVRHTSLPSASTSRMSVATEYAMQDMIN